MPELPTTVSTIDPILSVTDLKATLRYYVDVLGFEPAEWVEDGFTCVSIGDHGIYLCQGYQGQPGTWIWIGAGDVRALHALYKERGATIRMEPTNFPWALEMQVEDPDGHVLRFGSEPEGEHDDD